MLEIKPSKQVLNTMVQIPPVVMNSKEMTVQNGGISSLNTKSSPASPKRPDDGEKVSSDDVDLKRSESPTMTGALDTDRGNDVVRSDTPKADDKSVSANPSSPEQNGKRKLHTVSFVSHCY